MPGFAVVNISPVRFQCDPRIYQAHFAADLTELRNESEHIRNIQVIKNPQTQYDVELSVLLLAQIADVVLNEVDVLKTNRSFGKAGLFDVRFPTFNPNHVGS